MYCVHREDSYHDSLRPHLGNKSFVHKNVNFRPTVHVMSSVERKDDQQEQDIGVKTFIEKTETLI